jgi:hypothetical protein
MNSQRWSTRQNVARAFDAVARPNLDEGHFRCFGLVFALIHFIGDGTKDGRLIFRDDAGMARTFSLPQRFQQSSHGAFLPALAAPSLGTQGDES